MSDRKDEVLKIEKMTEENIDQILKDMFFEGRKGFEEATGVPISELIGKYTEIDGDAPAFYYIEDFRSLPSFEGQMFVLVHNRVFTEEFIGYQNGPDSLIGYEAYTKLF